MPWFIVMLLVLMSYPHTAIWLAFIIVLIDVMDKI